ncbi:MAG: alpha/beta hydrolase [Pseudomonadota bacterium]
MTTFPDELTTYFATNRNYRSGAFGNDFGDGDPRLFRVGEAQVIRQGGVWTLGEARPYPERSRRAPENARAEREWTLLGSETGFEAMRAAGLSGETSDILVFIHGAANSFASAAETLALMTELYSDTDRPYCPFFFSYPTNGASDPSNYFADRDDARLSGIAMARAFGRLVSYLAKRQIEEGCGQRVHLLAHSLGNFALRMAVEAIFANPAFRRIRLFDTVILAHADDDEDTLDNADKMRDLTRLTDDIVVYHDRGDKLLRLSDTVHRDRLGQKGPVPYPGVEVNGCRIAAVDCAGVAFDRVPDPQRHRHYLQSSAVIDDIRAVLRSETPPGRIPVDGREGHFRL